MADACAVVRVGLREVLKGALGAAIEIVEATCAREVSDRVRGGERWSLLILDPALGQGDGADLIREIHGVRNDLPILVFGVQREEVSAVRCLRAGAWTYVVKDAPEDQIAAAASEALAGRRHLSVALASLLAARVADGRERLPHERLSRREGQVLEGIALGKSLSEIGRELSLHVKTVSTHRRRMLDKLGLANNAQVVRYAISRQLVPGQ